MSLALRAILMPFKQQNGLTNSHALLLEHLVQVNIHVMPGSQTGWAVFLRDIQDSVAVSHLMESSHMLFLMYLTHHSLQALMLRPGLLKVHFRLLQVQSLLFQLP